MKIKRWFTITKTLCTIGLLSLLSITGVTGSTQASSDIEVEGTMLPAEKNKIAAIPPIDVEVPTDFQTASFGLG